MDVASHRTRSASHHVHPLVVEYIFISGTAIETMESKPSKKKSGEVRPVAHCGWFILANGNFEKSENRHCFLNTSGLSFPGFSGLRTFGESDDEMFFRDDSSHLRSHHPPASRVRTLLWYEIYVRSLIRSQITSFVPHFQHDATATTTYLCFPLFFFPLVS